MYGYHMNLPKVNRKIEKSCLNCYTVLGKKEKDFFIEFLAGDEKWNPNPKRTIDWAMPDEPV